MLLKVLNLFFHSSILECSWILIIFRALYWAGLNDGLFSETMDFRDFPSVLSAVRIAQG